MEGCATTRRSSTGSAAGTSTCRGRGEGRTGRECRIRCRLMYSKKLRPGQTKGWFGDDVLGRAPEDIAGEQRERVRAEATGGVLGEGGGRGGERDGGVMAVINAIDSGD